MKHFLVLLMLLSLNSSILSQSVIEYYGSNQLRLNELVIPFQDLNTEPTYIFHKTVQINNKIDTIFIYYVELPSNKLEILKISNGMDTISFNSPVYDEYLRITLASNPKLYTQFLIPNIIEFNEVDIVPKSDELIEILFEFDNSFAMSLIMPIPR